MTFINQDITLHRAEHKTPVAECDNCPSGKYQNLVLSEEALQRIAGDNWLPEEDLEQIRMALENIRLERVVEENRIGTTLQLTR